jgi:hypothetical protein
MNDITDEEWEAIATEMTDQITEIIEGKESDMIIEVLACIVADMLAPFEAHDGIPLTLAFMAEIVEKAYGLETKVEGGLMQ